MIFSRLSTGVRLTDVHNGLRLFTRAAAQRIRIRQNRMAHASEIIHRIGELGLKVAEAPVTIVYSEYSLRKGQRASNATADEGTGPAQCARAVGSEVNPNR